VTLLSKINLVKQLFESKKFRDAYVYEHVRNGIPFQIRALRKDRNWSQLELAEAANTSRTVITRIEDPNYGKLTIKTLLQIASAFNVALLIKFVPFSRLVREYEDVSWQALGVKSVADKEEVAKLEAWASGQSIDLLASLKQQTAAQFRTLDEPVSTSAVQHTLVFSSPTLVSEKDNSTSNQNVIEPAARAAAA
jgi:transcriptional regulator with XRE-family HTH domain